MESLLRSSTPRLKQEGSPPGSDDDDFDMSDGEEQVSSIEDEYIHFQIPKEFARTMLERPDDDTVKSQLVGMCVQCFTHYFSDKENKTQN